MRYGAIFTDRGARPFVVVSHRSQRPGFALSWLLASVIGIIGAFIWSSL
jgi:hypothetical protein